MSLPGLNMSSKSRPIALLLPLLLVLLTVSSVSQSNTAACDTVTMRCAKTLSAAAGKDGRIWFAWRIGQHLYVNYSDDRGQHYSAPVRVNQQPEDIATRGDNRPKIGVDDNNTVYLSWTQPREKKFTADIRFSYSQDGGNNFSPAITINDDGLLAGHSFNEMQVSNDGVVSISWLDKRNAVTAKQQGQDYTGSAVYYAQSTPNDGDLRFGNIHLADGSCVCCRMAMDIDQRGLPVVMWRHIFADNIRDHALVTLQDADQPTALQRVSFERWQINGCPHHGPTLTLQSSENTAQRIHMAWFNNATDASGLFYGYSDNGGQRMSETLHFASNENSPSHPHLAQNINGQLQLVWREYDGERYVLKFMQSDDGSQWRSPIEIASHQGVTDYPFLVQHPTGNIVLWQRSGHPLELYPVP